MKFAFFDPRDFFYWKPCLRSGNPSPYAALEFQPPEYQAQAPTCCDGGSVIAKSSKSMFFAVFSKTTQYFFSDTFGPLRRVFKTSFEKIKISQIEKFSTQKISHNFLEKNQKISVFCKNLKNFSIFFSGFSAPLETGKAHL